jgi:DNA-binding NtrC family response regulator
MTTIFLSINDTTLRITLKLILEAEGHGIVSDVADARVQFVEASDWRNSDLDRVPTILVASAGEIPDAVDAMSAGAWGYIFVPLQPHEACMAVARALGQSGGLSAETSLSDLRTMESVEFEHIALAVRLCNGNQAKAARALKIGRNTMWRKLKKMEKRKSDG